MKNMENQKHVKMFEEYVEGLKEEYTPYNKIQTRSMESSYKQYGSIICIEWDNFSPEKLDSEVEMLNSMSRSEKEYLKYREFVKSEMIKAKLNGKSEYSVLLANFNTTEHKQRIYADLSGVFDVSSTIEEVVNIPEFVVYF